MNNQPTHSALEHFLDLARHSDKPEVSNSEKKARRIANQLIADVLGLDGGAVQGIGELAKVIGAGGLDAVDRLRDTLDPTSPENTGGVRHLELRREASGPRHFLDHKPVHAGDLLALWTNHAWETVRYEWSYDTKRPATAWFSAEEGGDITESTLLRWPDASYE